MLDLTEAIEYFVYKLLGDATPLVADRHSADRGVECRRQTYAALFWRELDRIGDKVHQHLHTPSLIGLYA